VRKFRLVPLVVSIIFWEVSIVDEKKQYQLDKTPDDDEEAREARLSEVWGVVFSAVGGSIGGSVASGSIWELLQHPEDYVRLTLVYLSGIGLGLWFGYKTMTFATNPSSFRMRFLLILTGLITIFPHLLYIIIKLRFM